MKLEISLFKFDCKADYLPYYKKYFIKTTNEKTLYDLLLSMYLSEEFEYVKDIKSSLVVNGIFMDLSTSLEEIVNNFGTDLIIEPLSSKRSYKDLLIDDIDFKNSFEILQGFITFEEIPNKDELRKYYYASNTFNHNKDYMGDAVLFLASDLIEKNPLNKDKILEIISEARTGILYHTSLENRVFNYDLSYENKIKQLKKELNITAHKCKDSQSKKIDFNSLEENGDIKHSFKDFNIAYFGGLNYNNESVNFINQLEASKIKLMSERNDVAIDNFNKTQDFSLSLGSEVLLEAFDKNCDFLVVDDEKTFYFLDANRKKASKICGRDLDIPVLHINELKNLAFGNIEKTKTLLEKHSLKPELV